jgi:hypothetical protein
MIEPLHESIAIFSRDENRRMSENIEREKISASRRVGLEFTDFKLSRRTILDFVPQQFLASAI